MPPFAATLLIERALVAVNGADAVSFLDNLATNALDTLLPGDARFAALLTPQGKILFEFFALRTADGFLLEALRAKAAELIKRLTLYKLRAKVTIAEHISAVSVSPTPAGLSFADPRHGDLGYRCIGTHVTSCNASTYDAHRIALGVPEGGRDYALGDTFPHEANYDLVNGVSFTKGCFVGQEVVARMQNKTVVRKRVVKITGASPLSEGAAILIGDADIGRIGSVDGKRALALLRLDRVAEARAKGQVLTTWGQTPRLDGQSIASTVDRAGSDPIAAIVIVPDPESLARYARSVAERPVIDL